MDATEEFVLIPHSLYLQLNTQKPYENSLDQLKEKILKKPSIREKSKIISVLERKEPIHQNQEIDTDQILGELPFKTSQLNKSQIILNSIKDHPRLDIVDQKIVFDNTETGIRISTFLANIQHPTKNLSSAYIAILRVLKLPSHLIANKDAKSTDSEGWITFLS